MHHDTHIGPEQYFMHSVQWFHAQHEVLHVPHDMPFKSKELSKVFYNVHMATLNTLVLLLTPDPLHEECHVGMACCVK